MDKQVNLLTLDLKHVLYCGDNMMFLPKLSSGSVQLAVLDPPYNTGVHRVKHSGSYDDQFESSKYYVEWLQTVVEQCKRVLTDDGSLFLFINQHEEYNVWTMLRNVFGEDHLINKIIWAYHWGKYSSQRWTRKYDTIFWFAKDKDKYLFNSNESDRIAKRAPNLFGKGVHDDKLPTDCWWNTIVTASCGEATGYPTQKPLRIIERIIRVHSRPNDVVLDPFAGSGTVGQACERLGRNSILIERNPQAVDIMKKRLNYVNFYIRDRI